MRFSLHGSIVFHFVLLGYVTVMVMGSNSEYYPPFQFNVSYSNKTNVLQTVVGVELEGVGHSIYGGGLYSQMIFDESFEDPRDHKSNTHIFHASEHLDHSFRHCNSQLYATSFKAGGPTQDHYFTVVPALNKKAGWVSLNSINFPLFYIGPVAGLEYGRLGTIKNPPIPDDVSFQMVAGLGNPSMTSIKSMDGRFFTLLTSLTGDCSPYYLPPSGDVVLMSMANITAQKLTNAATFQLGDMLNVTTINAENYPALSIRHCNSQVYATTYMAGGPMDDHHFIIIPARNQVDGQVSFQSQNYPTYFIGPIVGLEPGRLGTYAPYAERADDVSFQIVKGLGNPSMSSIKSVDGRFWTVVPNVTGICSPYYRAPPDGDVVLMELEDIQKQNLTHQATFNLNNIPVGHSHWNFHQASVTCAEAGAFNGKCSAALTSSSDPNPIGGMPRIDNSGLYHRGLNITKESFQGYVFLKKLSGPDAKVTVGLLDKTGTLASQVFTVNSPSWTMFNFTLHSTGDAGGDGSFFIELNTAGCSVGVDQVFLEPGSWGLYKGLHMRADVTAALLLDGNLQSIRFDGSSILNNDWKWSSQRGPAWNRPAIYGDYWYHSNSGGFGMFEVLQLAEAADLASVVIGLNIYAGGENLTSCGDLIEYLYGNAKSTAMGRLRASDGHPAPYLDRVIFELGNEDDDGVDYVMRVSPLLTEMKDRLKAVAPSLLTKVKFGVALYSTDWDKEGNNASKIAMVHSTADNADAMIWDLHTGGSDLANDAADAMKTIKGMVQFFEEQGWKQKVPVFIGETNCAVSHAACSGLARALLSSLYIQGIVRSGRIGTFMPAVWGYSTCDRDGTICGATDGTNDWPQEALIITQRNVVYQPSWYARTMIGATWGNVSHTVVPDHYRQMSGGMLTILALSGGPDADDGQSLLNFQIVNTWTQAVDVSISVLGRKYCDSTFGFTVLGGVDLGTFNNVAHPDRCVPFQKVAKVDQKTGNAVFNLPSNSLAVALSVCVE